MGNWLVLIRFLDDRLHMSFYDSTKRKEAFTLIEVIVAMAIFALVIAGGIVGVRRGFELVDTSRHYTRSSQVLQSELELLRTLPWATLSSLTNDELTSKFNQQIRDQFGSGTYTGSVATEVFGGDKMKVAVNVEWSGRSARVHAVSYITYFTEGGVNDYYIN
mgnify:CR=1 FL=1